MTWIGVKQSDSVQQTLKIGQQIARALKPGDVVALVGGLGAGKTHLIKGIAAGLGVSDSRMVNSPTFVLVNEYEGRVPIHHLDAYRLNDAAELETLGFEEMCAGDAIVLVEWADRVSEAFEPFPETLWIEVFITGETERCLNLRTESAILGDRLASAGIRSREGGGGDSAMGRNRR